MPVPKGFRLAGRFLKAIPFAGDLAVGTAELYNPDEPDAAQRVLNALIIGAGGAGASAATAGLDIIPQLAAIAGDTPLENINPETLLRRLSYKLRNVDVGGTTGEQIRRIQKRGQSMPRQRGPEYEKVPLRF